MKKIQSMIVDLFSSKKWGITMVILWGFIMLPLYYQRIESCLDWNWKYTLNVLVNTSSVFGKDVFLTYGPLGFLGNFENIGDNLLLGCAFWVVLWLIFIC